MNLVEHMSSNTTDRACLAYTRQSAFGRRQSLLRVSYTSTMKQIMGYYHLHIERTQTVNSSIHAGGVQQSVLVAYCTFVYNIRLYTTSLYLLSTTARLFFFFFPCSADHERDWPPCKVVFFGLATNALNVRNK